MSQVIVRPEGVFLVFGSREIPLPGVHRLNANGSVTIRIPARDVTVEGPVDVGAHLDCTDFQLCLLARVLFGVADAQIRAIRPAMADAVQTWMTNHGLTAGSVD